MSDGDLFARLMDLIEAREREAARINATTDPLTGRRSSVRPFILTDDLRALLKDEV